ncbi:hypothetical protein KSP39_PZI014746 [Platanthera zijinensis]|uniref:Uncharacterized protein n=1 Tax=Platanthera zijinensis TaxID=2320716 RepID=A0AAP0BBG2_9ASPA
MPISEEMRARLEAAREGTQSQVADVAPWLARRSPDSSFRPKKAKMIKRPSQGDAPLPVRWLVLRPFPRCAGRSLLSHVVLVLTRFLFRRRRLARIEVGARAQDIFPRSCLSESSAPRSRDLPFSRSRAFLPSGLPPPSGASNRTLHSPACPGLGKTFAALGGEPFQGQPSTPRLHFDARDVSTHGFQEFSSSDMDLSEEYSPPPSPDKIADYLGDPRDAEGMKTRVAKLFRKHSLMLREIFGRVDEDKAENGGALWCLGQQAPRRGRQDDLTRSAPRAG